MVRPPGIKRQIFTTTFDKNGKMKISQTKPLFSQTKPLFSKPASWPHITVAIGLVVLTFYILARALNVLVNDSSVFPNERQNAILIAIIIVGIFFFGMGVIIEEWFFFRQVRSKILHSLVVSILVGVAVFILIYAAAFIIFGLIETGDHHGEIIVPDRVR